jgi:hypothetical protein
MDSKDMLIETSACAFQAITDYFLNNGKYGTQLSKSNGKHNNSNIRIPHIDSRIIYFT